MYSANWRNVLIAARMSLKINKKLSTLGSTTSGNNLKWVEQFWKCLLSSWMLTPGLLSQDTQGWSWSSAHLKGVQLLLEMWSQTIATTRSEEALQCCQFFAEKFDSTLKRFVLVSQCLDTHFRFLLPLLRFVATFAHGDVVARASVAVLVRLFVDVRSGSSCGCARRASGRSFEVVLGRLRWRRWTDSDCRAYFWVSETGTSCNDKKEYKVNTICVTSGIVV